jgi:hypothetical protein
MNMNSLSKIAIILLAIGLVLGLVGCKDDDDPKTTTATPYDDFFNYPNGRIHQNGMLTITNSANRETLLFHGTAAPANYIGTVGSLNSIRVNLPENNQFYAIIAIDKTFFEQRGFEASQVTALTFFSNSQAFSVSVSPSATWGAGTLRVNNHSDYWVQLKSSDGNQTYAAAQPGGLMLNIPFANGTYDIVPHFYRQIFVNNSLVGIVDMRDLTQSYSFTVNDANRLFIRDFTDANISPTTPPFVRVINGSNQGVRVFRSGTQMVTGTLQVDAILRDGGDDFFMGFEAGNNTNTINFRALAWGADHRFVPVDLVMQKDKAYIITIPANGLAAGITVVEVEASQFYD